VRDTVTADGKGFDQDSGRAENANALAAWAQPGPTRGNKLLLRLVHFVLPAILTGSLATLFIFFLVVAIATSKGLPEAEVIATARSTITVFATVCGVLLVVFVAPPTRLLAGGNAPSGDWRPTLLAAVLLGALTVLLSIPWVALFLKLARCHCSILPRLWVLRPCGRSCCASSGGSACSSACSA
jgi:hypothetical protein